VVVFGDPTKPGVFVSREVLSRLEGPTALAPRFGSNGGRSFRTLYFASGEKWDETKFKAYPSRRERKTGEMRFAHMKRILKFDRLRLRGLNGARDEVLLTATAQNLRRLVKLICRAQPALAVARVM
jgi:hypothetical protein